MWLFSSITQSLMHSVGSTDHSEAAQVEQCVLDMIGSVSWQDELVKYTQQISVQILSLFHLKEA